jgi:hypothetical protein
MIAKQSITSINWRSVIMTTNPNWSISYQYINDDRTAVESTYTVWDTAYVKLYNGETMTAEEYNKKYWNKVWTIKPYDMVDSKVFDTSPQSHSYYTLRDFLDDPKYQVDQKWWQCAAFVNDYLEKIWVGRYFGTEDAQTRASWCNSDTAKVWTIAVFDYNHYTDWKNYGHVWIVVDADENGFWVLDSNWNLKKPWVIQKRYIRYGSSSLKGFFDPSQPPRTSSPEDEQESWVIIPQWEYNPTRIWVYEAYINNGTAPTDAKLKSIWGGDLETWWKIFDSEVQAYMDATWVGTVWKRANDEITALRKEFNSQQVVKDYKDMKNSYDKLIASNDWTAAWDLSLIFSYMKMLDPGSVVREWEFANAQNAGGIPDKVINTYNKVVNGTRLTKKQREQFMDVAKNILDRYATSYNQLLDQYKSYAVMGGNTNSIWEYWTVTTTTWPTNDTQKYFDWLQDTQKSPANTGGVSAEWMTQKIGFISEWL